MPGAHRLGDICTGHCYPPRPNIQASNNVFVNSIGSHRQSDSWATHCCGNSCHAGVLAAGSPSVFVNSLQMSRIGDPVSCGSFTMTGSSNVFVGP